MDFSRDFLLLIKELFTEIYVFYKWFKMNIMTFIQFVLINAQFLINAPLKLKLFLKPGR